MSLINHIRFTEPVCDDPDCELHHPEVGVQEEVVSEDQVAFFVAGADELAKLIQHALDTYGSDSFVNFDEVLEVARDDLRRRVLTNL